ncbi:MAG: hypothetical protein AB8G99_25415 [Planctomycetaceae bacterium]
MSQVLYSPILYMWLTVIAIGFLLMGCLPERRQRSLVAIARDEDGAAYSLGLAILMPLYTLLICFVIECTLLLVVKIGVTQAAFAAARSAGVWLPAEPVGETSKGERVGMVHLAAVNNLTPFASGLDSHRVSVSPPPFAAGFHDVYARFVERGDKQASDYSQSKWNYAFAATDISFDPPLHELMRPRGRDHDEVVEVTVTYEMPFNISAVGVFLGSRSGLPGSDFYSRRVSSSFELQLERPQSANRRLGIKYDSAAANHKYRPGAN